MSAQRARPGRPAQGGSGARLLAHMGIAAYSLVASFVIIRSLFLSVGIADNLWVGGIVYNITDPWSNALQLVPGGDFELGGRMTVADWTMLALVILVPALVVARRPEF